MIPSGKRIGFRSYICYHQWIYQWSAHRFIFPKKNLLESKGLSKFRDVDGDGIISDKDRVVLGTAFITTIYSMYGNLAFKGFDFL